jgi:hypothetical protein
MKSDSYESRHQACFYLNHFRTMEDEMSKTALTVVKTRKPPTTPNVSFPEPGDIVTFKAGGKVSWCEGKAGKILPAILTEVCGDGDYHVMAYHRMDPATSFYSMGSVIDRIYSHTKCDAKTRAANLAKVDAVEKDARSKL